MARLRQPLVAALITLSFISPIRADGASEVTAAQIVAQFDAVAFGHEHGAELGRLVRWDMSPALALYALTSGDLMRHAVRVDRTVGELSKLTGLSFKAPPTDGQPTLRVGFYPRSSIGRLVKELSLNPTNGFAEMSACVAVAVEDGSNQGRIKNGIVIIGTDISESLQRHCVLEELVQVMGLPNDACAYRPSLFCEGDRVETLTARDRIVVRTLYDRRLHAGMARAEALPLVRTIVAELLAEGCPVPAVDEGECPGSPPKLR